MDLTEAEDNKIIRRGGKNTQNNYTIKDLHDPDIHNGMIIYQEPDILERESSGPQKASLQTNLAEVMEFQLSPFRF